MSKKRKPVQVCWQDSCQGRHGWQHTGHEKLTPATIYSVGYVHKRTKKYLRLVPHASDTGSGLGALAIPVGCITKIRKLK